MTDTKPFVLKKLSTKNMFNVDFNIACYGYEKHDYQHRVPRIKPNYHFRSDMLLKFLMFVLGGTAKRKGLQLFGHAGTGKSSLPEQVAARLNIPVWTIDCYNQMEPHHLFGKWGIKDGNTVWIDGPFTRAFKAGGWVVLEEADSLPKEIQTKLYAVLDGGDLNLEDKGDEIIRRKDSFALFSTGNTNGSDSEGAEHYLQSEEQSLAYLDRFNLIEVPYMEKGDEVELLNSLGLGVPLSTIESMVNVVNDTRTSFIQGSSPVTFSTRTAIEWLHEFAQERDIKVSLSSDDDNVDDLINAALFESLDTCVALRIGQKEEREQLYISVRRNFQIAKTSDQENVSAPF